MDMRVVVTGGAGLRLLRSDLAGPVNIDEAQRVALIRAAS
jgi:hypothetical protein